MFVGTRTRMAWLAAIAVTGLRVIPSGTQPQEWRTVWASSSAPKPASRRQLEKLGRGLVAFHHETGKVFIGWRMLGTDPETISFNVYRATGGRPIRVNATPVVDATSFTDTRADVTKANSYFLRPVLNRREQAASARFTLPANAPVRQYLSVPLQTPQGYSPNDGSVGDLDGDGEYELVIHQVGRGRDNSQPGLTTEPMLEAYKLDGTITRSCGSTRQLSRQSIASIP